MLVKGIFIGIIIVLIFMIFLKSNQEKYETDILSDELKYMPYGTDLSNELKYIPDEHVDNIYEIAQFMFDFFDKYQIPYWAIGGTLIGIVRNQPPGPIRWDDDIDVAILQKHEKKLMKAMKNDKEFKRKIKFKLHDFGYQLRLKNDTFLYKKYYFDIFIYKKMDGKHGKKYYCNVAEFDDFYYNSVKEILPIRKAKFWDLDICIPNKLNTVQRGYEEDVLKYATIYNHKNSGQMCDLSKNVNSCNLLPMLTKNIIKKLQFTN